MTACRNPIAWTAALVLALAPAAVARAELATWDQAKVTALTQQLVAATTALYDSFYKQPVPPAASGQYKVYHHLKQKVRRLRSEARTLAGDVKKGGGRVETKASFDDLMLAVRDARQDAPKVFTGADVQEKATAARDILNQLGPYYDAGFQPLQPAAR
jgi:hypothetical protein